MRSVSLFAVAVLAVLMLSAAMPASAHINLLQNPGFETGDFSAWQDHLYATIVSPGHTGEYAAYINVPGGELQGFVYYVMDTPQCAEYLEFWYMGEGEFGLGYSDVPYRWWYLDWTDVWTLFHVDLDTTKLVARFEVGAYPGEQTSFGPITVDDFDLEACSAPAVGGVVMPANTLAVLVPCLAVIGLVGCISAVVVVAKKRR